jgi:hypothetical protein
MGRGMPMRRSQKHPSKPTVFIKILRSRSLGIFDRRSRNRLRTIRIEDEIADAGIAFQSASRGQSREIVWINLRDNRTLIFNPRNGRLLAVQPDPCTDPAVQKWLDAILARADSPVRFAVAQALSRQCTMYYDFADGGSHNNRISATSMFMDREVAIAAANALNKQCEPSPQGRSPCGRSFPWQVVEFRKTASGGTILGDVQGPAGPYWPILCRRKQEFNSSHQ